MKTSKVILFTLLVFTTAALPAQVVPEYINYQGQLRAADGSPLPTGNYTIEFNIYDQANLGTKVWGPFLFDGVPGMGHGLEVPVVNGSFNVILGPTDTNGVSITKAFTAANRFIEIRIVPGAPILPRQQFLCTAYAMQSQTAQMAQLAQMAVQASNLVQNAAEILCPPGTIVAFGGASAPNGWLLCDGRSLSSTNWPSLYDIISTNWGNGSYNRGTLENDPTKDFNVPDLRGMFLRGVNHGRSTAHYDPDAADRTGVYPGQNGGDNVGSTQWDGFREHSHANDIYRYLLSKDSLGRYSAANTDTSPNEPDIYHAEPLLNAGGKETRPMNAYVNFIIKY